MQTLVQRPKIQREADAQRGVRHRYLKKLLLHLFLRDVRKLSLLPISGRPLPTQQLWLSQENIGPDRNSRVKGEQTVRVHIYVCVEDGI